MKFNVRGCICASLVLACFLLGLLDGARSETVTPTWYSISHNGGARSWRSVAVHKNGVVMAAVVKNGGL